MSYLIKGSDFKAKNIAAFQEIINEIKKFDFTDPSNEAQKHMIKYVLLSSKEKFSHLRNDHLWIEEIIPNIIWMAIADIDHIEESWFNESDEDQWFIFNSQFAG